MMKKFAGFILVLSLLFPGPVFAGSMTANGYFYKPSYGEKGPAGYSYYNAALDATDVVLKAMHDGFNALAAWASTDNVVTLITATPTYVDADTFTVPGDYTSRFSAGKVVQAQVAAGMVYSTVASSSYAAPTTTVNLNDAVLTDPITRVYVVTTRDGLWPNGPGYVVSRDYGTDRAALEAADAVAVLAGKELRITYPHAIDDDVTLAAPKVTIQPDAVLAVSTTKTLTINGSLNAGPYQIFSCAGTGVVAFGAGTVPYAYAEWWGITGAADDVAINAALTAAKHIRLLPNKTYAITAAVSAVSNGSLIAPDLSTILSGDASAGLVILNINGKTNFEARGFKIDGNQPGAPNNGLGISVTGNASDIRLKDLWIYDADVYGCRIQPGSGQTIDGVFLDNVYITSGCSTSALTIAGYSVAGTASNTKNIYANGVKIDTVDAIGVSINAWQGVNAANVVDNVHFTNFKANACGTYSWTPNEGVTNCSLVGFDINASGANGIQVELCSGFAIANGAVHNGAAHGIRIIHTATTALGASNGTIQNVSSHSNAYSGFDIGSSATKIPTNITIRDCKSYSNTLYGINIAYVDALMVDNCKCYDNVEGGILIPGSGAAVTKASLLNNLCYVSGGAQAYGIRVGGATVTALRVLGNRCWSNGTANLSIVGSPDIIGESVSCMVGTVAAGTDTNAPVLVAPGPNGTVILDCVMVNGAALAAGNPNYETFTLQDCGADGSASNAILTFNTNSGGDNKSLAAYDGFSIVTNGGKTADATHKILAAGDVVSFLKVHAGAGVGITNLLVKATYLTY